MHKEPEKQIAVSQGHRTSSSTGLRYNIAVLNWDIKFWRSKLGCIYTIKLKRTCANSFCDCANAMRIVQKVNKTQIKHLMVLFLARPGRSLKLSITFFSKVQNSRSSMCWQIHSRISWIKDIPTLNYCFPLWKNDAHTTKASARLLSCMMRSSITFTIGWKGISCSVWRGPDRSYMFASKKKRWYFYMLLRAEEQVNQ